VFIADSSDGSVSLRAAFAQRLMKARKGFAAFTIMAVAAAGGLVFAWNTGLFGGGAAAAAAQNAAVHEEAALRAEHLAFTEPYLAHEVREVRVGNGETLAGLISRAGATPADASAATSSIGAVYDPRRLRPGQSISLFFSRRSGGAELTGIAFRSAPGASVTANRTMGGFTAREVLMPVTFEIARIAAPVETSLYASALQHGATDREIAALADAFSYDVDFQRDVRPGDEFELVFERFYDDEGNTVRTGELLFVGLETRRGRRDFYQFLAPSDPRPDWYDAVGTSARKFLMRTPINGARLSSGFGMRRHPILGYSRMHRGTDFAAPTGTAILAAGDGTVVRASRYGAYGNYIRIRHANGYETAYAHMSRYARGMRAGARVRQGQVIGYVGTTGRSTGPHLHYEVLRRGAQINPVNLRVANGRNLTGRALELFQIERARIDTLRQVRASETPADQAALRPVNAASAAAP
jgi:murein DD-endopeptidase MepM/ murein hydrolase activator NlpD